MPARRRCSAAKSCPVSRARAASSAAYSSRRRGVSSGRGARVQRAELAVGCREADAHNRAPLVVVGRPGLAGVAGRTGRNLLVPVEGEVLDGEGLGPSLPLVVLGHRPDQLDAACAGRELVCIHVAGVHQVLGGQQILGCQRAVYWRQRIAIHDRRGRRLDVGDKMRPFLVARLRQVDHIADPGGRALLGVVHVRIVGRGDHQQRGKPSTVVRQRTTASPIAVPPFPRSGSTGTRQKFCIQTRRSTLTAGTSRSQASAPGAVVAASRT